MYYISSTNLPSFNFGSFIIIWTAVRTAAKLLKCSRENLVDALQTRKIHAGNEMIIQELTYAQVDDRIDDVMLQCLEWAYKTYLFKIFLTQAADSRDALAKAIYAELFDWLVERINNSFESGKHHTGRSITILDIYGFESFVVRNKVIFSQVKSSLCFEYYVERIWKLELIIGNSFLHHLLIRTTVSNSYASIMLMKDCSSTSTDIYSNLNKRLWRLLEFEHEDP